MIIMILIIELDSLKCVMDKKEKVMCCKIVPLILVKLKNSKIMKLLLKKIPKLKEIVLEKLMKMNLLLFKILLIKHL
jgi:hypothetical protein